MSVLTEDWTHGAENPSLQSQQLFPEVILNCNNIYTISCFFVCVCVCVGGGGGGCNLSEHERLQQIKNNNTNITAFKLLNSSLSVKTFRTKTCIFGLLVI